MSDAEDIQACESCGKGVDVERCTLMGDCWFCPDCTAEWQAIFASCTHKFVPYTLDGEDGLLCDRCCGFVADMALETKARCTTSNPPTMTSSSKEDSQCALCLVQFIDGEARILDSEGTAFHEACSLETKEPPL